MSNRKRVTLTFEIDGSDGYNNEAFLRRDFLQELRCCVNDPYEDTFVMKVEDADDPHEMSAVEYDRERRRMCEQYGYCSVSCPLHDFDAGCMTYEPITQEAQNIVEQWAREHPERRENDGID